jgi:hypothetical protein
MFEPTQPASELGLQRVSDFQRRHGEAAPAEDSAHARLTSLNPSLMQDLLRFDGGTPGEGMEVIEVLAAAVRHARPLLLHLQHEHRVIPLTVFPVDRLVQAPLDLPQLLALRLPDLHVLGVQPARTRADTAPPTLSPLGPLLWELALRGSRDDLLPELAGQVAYRIAPGANLDELDMAGTLAAAVARLRRENATLRTLAGWPGFDRERAMRMLNGLYLQAALMISRTHPAATGSG